MEVKFTELTIVTSESAIFMSTFFRNVAYRGFARSLWVPVTLFKGEKAREPKTAKPLKNFFGGLTRPPWSGQKKKKNYRFLREKIQKIGYSTCRMRGSEKDEELLCDPTATSTKLNEARMPSNARSTPIKPEPKRDAELDVAVGYWRELTIQILDQLAG